MNVYGDLMNKKKARQARETGKLVNVLPRIYTMQELFDNRRKIEAKKSKRLAKAKRIKTPRPRKMKLYKKDAWKAFSTYIKSRDKYTCYTCGAQATGSGLHAGHFIPATRRGTWLDERNVHAQCYRCNIWLRGNSGDYAQRLIRDYGPQIIEELVGLSHQEIDFTAYELVGVKDLYERKLADLSELKP